MSGGHVILALGGRRGFRGERVERGGNFTTGSDGIELALERFDLFFDGQDLAQFGCR